MSIGVLILYLVLGIIELTMIKKNLDSKKIKIYIGILGLTVILGFMNYIGIISRQLYVPIDSFIRIVYGYIES